VTASPRGGRNPVERIPLPGIGLDYPGAQLDGEGEGGDVAAPLGQGQGGADPERQAVRERGEPIEIDPATIHLGMTMRRVELAPERPDRQRRMTGERGVKPAHGKGRRFQRGDPITVGKPITHARPLFLIDPGRESRGEANVPEPTST
jgi:hypothetical protein